MINKDQVIKLIDEYIKRIDDNLTYYYNKNDYEITKDQNLFIDRLIVQKLILKYLKEDIEKMV